jgi:NAD(P)-dependent dehydrogenase (short-subunit alcohol dehydrogenase family)
MTHPALQPGRVAVVTGAASGIGLAAAKAFADMGMVPLLVDRDEGALDAALEAVGEHLHGGAHASSYRMDVSDPSAFHGLMHAADALQAPIGVLMNNAGVGGGGDALAPRADWDRVLGVNFFGILNGTQAFAPALIAQDTPSLIINTGSKQGITTPPGDTAYNVSKAAVKALTEGLAHTLRNTPGCKVSARLLIPGFVFTGMTRRHGVSEKPAGAWTPEETVAFMLERIEAEDFYILCPDNDATPQIDRKRIAWAAGDIIEGRPALSRWHPDYAEAFAAHMAKD